MAESIKDNSPALGDDQQRPEAEAMPEAGSDQQPTKSAPTQQAEGAPVIQFASHGINRTFILSYPRQGDDAPAQQPHGVFRIEEVENDDAPGDFRGIVMYSPGTTVEEIRGETTPVNVVTGFSCYERHDPTHDNDVEIEFDPETGMGTITDISDPNNPIVITRNAHIISDDRAGAGTITVKIGDTDDAGRAAMKDAFTRRMEKSRAQMTRAAMEHTQFNSRIARSLFESTSLFADALQTTISPAIQAAAKMAQELTPETQKAASSIATFAKSIPVIDMDDLRNISKAMREWARDNVILLTIVDQWKIAKGLKEGDELEGDDAPEDIESTENRVIDALRFLAAAYSETHGGVDAILSDDGESFDLPPEAEKEIRQLASDYAAFHNQHKESPYMETVKCFSNGRFNSEGQTELKSSDEFSMMVSKAARRQADIARAAQEGLSIFVGGGADIFARITDKDGKALDLTDEEKQIQDVIGDMIQRNGKPLNVTPAQIWREWKGIDKNVKVHESDIAHIREIMERLMFAPSVIDYAQQAAKHKGVTRQNDFEYAPIKARLEGTLISAIHGAIKTKRGSAEGYIIYDYPLFYRYSHGFNQIGTFSKKLLTGARKPAKRSPRGDQKAQGTAPIYGGNQKTMLQRYLISRLDRIQSDGQKVKGKVFGTVLIDEIADDCKLALTEKAVRTLRKDIETIFSDWATMKAESHLEAWDIAKRGRKIVGWNITVSAQKKKGT